MPCCGLCLPPWARWHLPGDGGVPNQCPASPSQLGRPNPRIGPPTQRTGLLLPARSHERCAQPLRPVVGGLDPVSGPPWVPGGVGSPGVTRRYGTTSLRWQGVRPEPLGDSPGAGGWWRCLHIRHGAGESRGAAGLASAPWCSSAWRWGDASQAGSARTPETPYPLRPPHQKHEICLVLGAKHPKPCFSAQISRARQGNSTATTPPVATFLW